MRNYQVLNSDETDGIQGLYYQHNANDDITKITNGADAGLTQDYAYDALSRITSQIMPGNSMSLGYDSVGNRTSRSDNGLPTAYGYPATNHRLLSATTGGTTRWFNTNAVGNIDAWHGADGVYNATSYDAYLRPKTHTRGGFTTTYRFNALDQRVLKYQGGGNSTRYVYAGQNTMLAERFISGNGSGSQWTSYLWLGGQPVGLVKGNTLYWVHADHLGRPEMVTNTSQQRVWRAANRAFERGIALDQIGGYNLGFPGQYYDSESNLWQNGFRDYEPTIGRYMQSDPIGLAGGINTYGYVGGNPVNFVDLLGLKGAGAASRTNNPQQMRFTFQFSTGPQPAPQRIVLNTTHQRWGYHTATVRNAMWREGHEWWPASDYEDLKEQPCSIMVCGTNVDPNSAQSCPNTEIEPKHQMSGPDGPRVNCRCL
jgi:RHS repeat-associated protein